MSAAETTLAPATSASVRTPSKNRPNQANKSPLSAVLTQPASRKHALEAESQSDALNNGPPNKKHSPSTSSTISIPSAPVKSLTLQNLSVIQRSTYTPDTAKPKGAVAKKSAPSSAPLSYGDFDSRPLASKKTIIPDGKDKKPLKFPLSDALDKPPVPAAKKSTKKSGIGVVKTKRSPGLLSNSDIIHQTKQDSKVTKSPAKENLQTRKLQRLMKIHVDKKKLHLLTAASKTISTTKTQNTNSSPASTKDDLSASQTENLTEFTKSAYQRPPYEAPIPTPTMTRSVSTPSSVPVASSAPPPKQRAASADASPQSVAIQTQNELDTGDTSTAPASSPNPPPPTPAEEARTLAQTTTTHSTTTEGEEPQGEPVPSSPERRRIVDSLNEESPASTSEDSLPSSPPRERTLEDIPEDIHNGLVKLRSTSPGDREIPASQPGSLPPPAQTIPVGTHNHPSFVATTSPHERDTEIVVGSPRLNANKNLMPSPAMSDLSTLSSQFEHLQHIMPTTDDGSGSPSSVPANM